MAAYYGLYVRAFPQSLLPALHIHRKKTWSEISVGIRQFHKRRNFSSSSILEQFFWYLMAAGNFSSPQIKKGL